MAGEYSPINSHWVEKWFQFEYKGKTVKIHGITNEAIMGPPVNSNQLDVMIKQDSILYYVQLDSVNIADSAMEVSNK